MNATDPTPPNPFARWGNGQQPEQPVRPDPLPNPFDRAPVGQNPFAEYQRQFQTPTTASPSTPPRNDNAPASASSPDPSDDQTGETPTGKDTAAEHSADQDNLQAETPAQPTTDDDHPDQTTTNDDDGDEEGDDAAPDPSGTAKPEDEKHPSPTETPTTDEPAPGNTDEAPEPLVPAVSEPSTSDTFDPTKVPAFPVITVEVIAAEHAFELLVDGRTQSVPDGESPTDAAVAAAAGIIQERGLRYSRVAGIIDGQRHLFVVGADGSRHDLTAPATRSQPEGGLRQRLDESKTLRGVVFLGGFGLLVVVAVAAFAVIISAVTRPGDTTPEAAPIPPAAELPVLPPAGWSSHATWAQPIHDRTRIADLDNGWATIIVDDQHAATIRPDTGQIQWSLTLSDTWQAGPWNTTIDGQPVIAVQTRTSLDWWPATGEPHDRPTGSFPLGRDTTLNHAGTTPMAVLPDQKAIIITAAGGLNRTIPAGAVPLRADDTTITAVNAAGQIWHLNTDSVHPPGPTSTLTTPDGITNPATWTIHGTAGNYILATATAAPNPDTTGQTSRRTVLTTLDGTIVAHAGDQARPTTTWSASSSHAATGNLMIELETGKLTTLDDTARWDLTAVIGDTAYGTSNGQPATLTIDGTIHTHPAGTSTPIHTDPDRAYATYTDTNSLTWLYALPPL